MAEGTPLERVQVVNSGARVQIPPSPLCFSYFIYGGTEIKNAEHSFAVRFRRELTALNLDK